MLRSNQSKEGTKASFRWLLISFMAFLVQSSGTSMSGHRTGSPYGSWGPEVRLVLLGNIGCGKTTSADTILGQLSPVSVSSSRSCQLRSGTFDQRNVRLVEAPRWYWSGGKMEESVRKETQRAVTLVAPGLHAILLLVPVNQFTEMDSQVPAELQELFGEEVLAHTIVLLTCGDYLMRLKAEEYLQKQPPGLRGLIAQCGGRYHVFNNRQQQNREQVQQLLEKVDSMVRESGEFHMKTDQERQLEKRVKERKQELMEEYRAQKEQRKESKASQHLGDAKPRSSSDGPEERTTSMDRERNGMEAGAGLSHVHNRLYADHQSASPYEREVTSSPSPRLKSGGAILSQKPEVKPPPSQTGHYRFSGAEDGPSEVSLTSSSQLLVFSSSTSSPSSSATSSSSSSFPTVSSAPELRLVLLGRSGSGKSTAGNVILGQEEFKTLPESLTAVTKACEKKRNVVEGRRVAVVDTPDWFNSERTPDEVRAEISACVTLSSPGPHVFLFCVPLDQPAKTELQALAALESVFGPEAVQKHTIVLFTHADRLKESKRGGGVEAYIAGQRGDLLKLVEKCRDRFHVLELGSDLQHQNNVSQLLENVEQTVEEAGGQCYSCPAFQEAEDRVRQRQMEIVRERKRNKVEEEGRADVRQLGSQRRVLYPYLQPLAEAEEEEVKEDEIERTRDEAEMSVKAVNIESLPPVSLSHLSPSLVQSVMEKMQPCAQHFYKLMSNGAGSVGSGATRVKNSPVWATVGSRAQDIQKMVAESPVWERVGSSAGQVSKLVGDRVPKVVVESSAWVGSGAKAAAASPVWGKVGSGAKLVADGSVRVGTGIGAGAKTVAQSPLWGKMGSAPKRGPRW
ncbi:uncharacterized protein LOC130527258 isoform X1 [Takifugu flavidus]|nr:uncharacterized protein LOC130527258 isoform X1 [Takifugu flavidus]